MKILPLTYMGNIEYFTNLIGGDCVIDICENFVKQTHRSRCDILSANGTSILTVNVQKGSSIKKKAVKDIRIDNSRRWQHQHRLALISAYKNSPYFDHYWDSLSPFFERNFEFLADFNIEMLDTLLKLLKSDIKPLFSDQYIVAEDVDYDMRMCFPRKKDNFSVCNNSTESVDSLPLNIEHYKEFRSEPYYQVFSEKIPFQANLSVVDLLFCEGPLALNFLAQ